MNQNPEWVAEVDQEGRLVLPPELLSQYGLTPGARARIDPHTNGLRLRRPVTQLTKVYVEPTSRCNLNCTTCMRNKWDEQLGAMSDATWQQIARSLSDIRPAPTVFFGGLGEPLAHPAIVSMVKQAKALGAPTELITNGTLLNERVSTQLLGAGLDMLWVSLDGATPETYGDVRLGAALAQVLDNLFRFRELRRSSPHTCRIGIEFVAMKRNIADLPEVLRIAGRAGARRLVVSNLLPYSPDMADQVLYTRTLSMIDQTTLPADSKLAWQVDLPQLDWDQETREALYQVMRQWWRVRMVGADPGQASDYCPFIESGSMAIAWDGGVSPCIPLMHNHTVYLGEREHFSRRYVAGQVQEGSLLEIWNSPAYVAFRARVQTFDYAPCLSCGGCQLFEKNEEDCFGNTFPACGGCLWAQGLIRCP